MRLVVDVMGRPEALGMGAEDVIATGNEEDELVLGAAQRIISISWNALKECFMCIAAAAECAIPVHVHAAECASDNDANVAIEEAFVAIADVMLETLFVIKHNGALDYAYRGLASIGEAMLRRGGERLADARYADHVRLMNIRTFFLASSSYTVKN